MLCTRNLMEHVRSARDAHYRRKAARHGGLTSGVLKKVKRATSSVQSEKSPLCNVGGGDGSVEVDLVSGLGPMPAVLRATVDEFQELESEIRRVMQTLDELQLKKLRSHFRSEAEERHESAEMGAATENLSKLFRQTDRNLEGLQVVASHQGGKHSLQFYRNLQAAYSSRFAQLARNFQSSQQKFIAASQKSSKRENSMFRKEGSSSALMEELERAEARDRYMDRGLTEEQVETLMQNESFVQERDGQVRALLNSLTALHEVFQDVNTLVLEQGTVLDQIDYNLITSKESIEKAGEELVVAKKHQDAGLFKLCLLFLLVMILGFALVIVLKALI